MTTEEPKGQARTAAARAGMLVAISGPYDNRIRRRIDGVPLANLALASTITAFNVGLTTGPQRMITRAVDERMGPAVTPDQMAARRRMVLLGNAATVAAGVLAQRALNHARWRGPVAEAARVTAAQLAIGGVASAVVTVTDMAVGPEAGSDAGAEAGPDSAGRQAAPFAVAALTLSLQRRLVRRGAARVTLPQAPRSVSVPVRSRWRTAHVPLPLVD